MAVKVNHWRHETGEPEFVGESIVYPTGYRESPPRGWYCWAYPDNDYEFEQWMKINCPKSSWQHRFNSGDPMYTVQISDAEEATSFKLQWM